MKRTYKFRLYPTSQQQTTLRQWLTTCRLLYNNALAARKETWHMHQQSVSYYEQATYLKYGMSINFVNVFKCEGDRCESETQANAIHLPRKQGSILAQFL